MNFVEKIYFAIRKSHNNSIELFNDGVILETNNRLPRSFTMYHFSFEEIGRCYILIQIFFDFKLGKIKFSDLKPKILNNRGFSKHQIKLQISIQEFKKMASYYLEKEGKNDLIKTIDQLYNQYDVEKMDSLKNNSLYLCFEKNQFLSPNDVIDQEIMSKIKYLAEINIEIVNKILVVLENEVDFKRK